MAFLGLLIALALFIHFNRRMRHYRRRYEIDDPQSGAALPAPSWHDQWHRVWAEKFERQARRRACQFEEQADKHIAKLNKKARKLGVRLVREGKDTAADTPQSEEALEREMMRRARRRANA